MGKMGAKITKTGSRLPSIQLSPTSSRSRPRAVRWTTLRLGMRWKRRRYEVEEATRAMVNGKPDMADGLPIDLLKVLVDERDSDILGNV